MQKLVKSQKSTNNQMSILGLIEELSHINSAVSHYEIPYIFWTISEKTIKIYGLEEHLI
jgi:hypothetical protein